jgi:pSer/pThr/pTyr-binding forkhead associated (FHA) protein
MKCANCGTQNPEEASFCNACGTRIASAPSPEEVQASSVANLRAAVERMVAARIAAESGFVLSPPPPAAPVVVAGPVAPPAPAPEPVASGPAATTMVAPPIADEFSRGAPVRNDFRLIFVHRDGSDGTAYHLRGDQIDIGRTEGDLLFEDPYLSPRHARITSGREGQVLSDLESLNGVFIRLRVGAHLYDGDVIMVGKQVLKFELVPDFERTLAPTMHHNIVTFGTIAPQPWGRLRQIGPTGTSHDVFHFSRDQVVIGREQGDIVFSDDNFMSRRHAYLSRKGAGFELEDLGSSNGTFLRIRESHFLVPGDQVRMGNVLLRFEHT